MVWLCNVRRVRCICVCVFFCNGTATTDIYTLSLLDALPISAHFSLQQRPAFFTPHFSLRQRSLFLYSPFLVVAAPLHFILPISRCCSARDFYTYQYSLRQRPGFLYCPFLVAAAPRFLYSPFLVVAAPRFSYCPFLVAAAPVLFILPISRCCSARAFYTYQFS